MGLVSIHCAVLLFGLAGLFGKTIELSSLEITWGRTTLAAVALGGAILFKRLSFKIKKSEIISFVIMGLLLAVQWWTFFHAIQIATVAIGLLSFASFPIIVMFIEPFTDNVSFKYSNLGYAFVSLLGVGLVLPDLSFQTDHSVGGLYGILSGALYAVVTIMNRRYIKTYSAVAIGFWQYLFASLILSLFVIPSGISLDLETGTELLVLGFVFTALAHGLFIHGLREVQAGIASLIGTLEPVYGVVAAAALLNEVPTRNTILGGIVVLGVILAATIRASSPAEETIVPSDR